MQLSIRLSIPKSSLYAILRTMVDRGWLQIDANGSVYQLGLHSLVVRSVYLDGDPALARASSVLDEVAAATRETIHLGRPDGAEVIYTAKRESIHPLRMYSAVGRRLPAFATSLGRALLAKMPAEARREMTSKTTAHKDAVLEIIDRAAYQGYANESEESCMGVRCSASRSPSTTPPSRRSASPCRSAASVTAARTSSSSRPCSACRRASPACTAPIRTADLPQALRKSPLWCASHPCDDGSPDQASVSVTVGRTDRLLSVRTALAVRRPWHALVP
jgi:hypothetical protein